MRDVLRAGADKVSLNTAAVADPTLDRALCRPVRAPGGRRRHRCPPARTAATAAGRSSSRAAARRPGLDAVDWAAARRRARRRRAAGDLDRPRRDAAPASTPALLRAIIDRVQVPVIASGGAAGPADFVAAVVDGGADAVLAASIFHRRIHSIAEVKAAMAAAGLPVRLVPRGRGMTGEPWRDPAMSRSGPTASSRRSSRTPPTAAS